ncbi:CYTH domain-containing protein [Oceanobacillus piezotolerans]|uniref:CYTH domain-containing protein n=1 Tax=Oceanobacillus piezotolerans TaxID=2448030 RepID=A0A498D8X1_9BACI|nr:CYTH domain-containing protein [Oceanobacillus piezotolerans]RLL45071.1 CYTH domain-containing protein [Oceanobacillus piezotolerans]
MTQEIEIEFKNLLTKKEFDLLLSQLPFPMDGIKQTNYYFETDDFSLKSKGSALRIREKEGNYYLTLKEPHMLGLLETHEQITKEEAYKWRNNEFVPKATISKQLTNLGIVEKELRFLGELTTIRREIPYHGTLLVLDYSIYNNESDYELELEANNKDDGIYTFQQILDTFQIERKETPNKIERFYRSLLK